MGATDTPNATRPVELSVVMPVYNEASMVGPVVRSWIGELDRLKIAYEFSVYDDGSSDGTTEVLNEIAAGRSRLTVKRHANMGHGPTISRGYRESIGEWVFQVDSDDEMTPASFGRLWACRANYDLVLGCRENRHSRLSRRILSSGSRAVVRLLFGKGLWDVNTPYRLIRRSALAAMLSRIPSRAFAPNVIMAGLALRDRLRICQIWVPYQPRRAGTDSIVGWRQWRTAARCAIETASVALGRRAASRHVASPAHDAS